MIGGAGAIDGLILNDFYTFQLAAVTVTGEPVCGEANVMVIDRGSVRVAGNRRSSSADQPSVHFRNRPTSETVGAESRSRPTR